MERKERPVCMLKMIMEAVICHKASSHSQPYTPITVDGMYVQDFQKKSFFDLEYNLIFPTDKSIPSGRSNDCLGSSMKWSVDGWSVGPVCRITLIQRMFKRRQKKYDQKRRKESIILSTARENFHIGLRLHQSWGMLAKGKKKRQKLFFFIHLQFRKLRKACIIPWFGCSLLFHYFSKKPSYPRGEF